MPGTAPATFDWQPDIPDPRDLRPGSPRVRRLLRALSYHDTKRPNPVAVDWREFFPPCGPAAPEGLGVAASCVSLIEYFERRGCGRDRPGAVRFVHDVARRLGGPAGGGASLRTTLKAAVRFGVPPARHVVPDEGTIPPFLFGFADAFKKALYVRLDDVTKAGEKTLTRLRVFLAGGFPCLLGFAAPGSISHEADVPMPTAFDTILGGRAALVAGYDDARRVRSARGACLISTGWGADWGDGGYGWLPFDFVRQGLAVNIWTLIHPRWLKSGEFGWQR
jgi:hypothetical protein